MPQQPPISTSEFTRRLADKLSKTLDRPVSVVEARTFYRTMHALILDTVIEGNDVVIWGFGRFYLRYYGNNMAEESGNPVKYTALALKNSHKIRNFLTDLRPSPEVLAQNMAKSEGISEETDE